MSIIVTGGRGAVEEVRRLRDDCLLLARRWTTKGGGTRLGDHR